MKYLLKLLLLFTSSTYAQKLQLDWARQWLNAPDASHLVMNDTIYVVIPPGTIVLDADPGTGVVPTTTLQTAIVKLSSAGEFISYHPAPEGKLVVDGEGNMYVYGGFGKATDFDPGPGIYSLTPSSNGNSYVAKLTPGGHFKWVKTLKGDVSALTSAAVSSGSTITFLGSLFGKIDCDPGPGTYNLQSSNGSFLIRLDTAGSLIESNLLTEGHLSVRSFLYDSNSAGHLLADVSPTVILNPATTFSTTLTYGTPRQGYLQLSPSGVLKDILLVPGEVRSVVVTDHYIYLGGSSHIPITTGDCSSTTGNGYIVKFDGSNKCLWIKNYDMRITTLHEYNGQLLVGAYFNDTFYLPSLQGSVEISSGGQLDAIAAIANGDGIFYDYSLLSGVFDQKELRMFHTSTNIFATGKHAGQSTFAEYTPHAVTLQAQGPNHHFSTFICKYKDLDVSIPELHRVGLSLYPNPANDILHIVGEDKVSRVHVYNTTGCLVADGYGIDQIDVSGLNAGVYLIHVFTADGKVSRQKFIRQ